MGRGLDWGPFGGHFWNRPNDAGRSLGTAEESWSDDDLL